MSKKDWLSLIIVSLLTTVFLTPTLKNLGVYDKIPSPNIVIFVIYPALAIIGMFSARLLGNFAPILWQMAKFALVGVSNTAIDFGILNFLIIATSVTGGVGIIPLNAASFSVATINSYFWNKSWVFSGTKKSSFVIFLIVSILGIALNTAVVFTLTTLVRPLGNISPSLWANIAKVLATIVSLVWNFLGYKLIVFKK